jgi:hypothetical protein
MMSVQAAVIDVRPERNLHNYIGNSHQAASMRSVVGSGDAMQRAKSTECQEHYYCVMRYFRSCTRALACYASLLSSVCHKYFTSLKKRPLFMPPVRNVRLLHWQHCFKT